MCDVKRAVNFGQALALMKVGRRLQRSGWNGHNMWVALYVPEQSIEAMTLPYLYLRTVSGQCVPWTASQLDLLSEDWYSIEEGDIDADLGSPEGDFTTHTEVTVDSENRWSISKQTTPSGKTQFVCAKCGRVSIAPDKTCPAGCGAPKYRAVKNEKKHGYGCPCARCGIQRDQRRVDSTAQSDTDQNHNKLTCVCGDCASWRIKRRRAVVEVLRYVASFPCREDNCGTACKCEPCMARQAIELFDPEWRG